MFVRGAAEKNKYTSHMQNTTGTTNEYLIATDLVATALATYRKRARRVALAGSLVAVGSNLWNLSQANDITAAPIIFATFAILGGTVSTFRRTPQGSRRVRDVAETVWALAIIAILVGDPALSEPALRFGAFILPIAATGALLTRPRTVAVVAGFAVAGYVAPETPFSPDDPAALAAKIAIFSVIAVAIVGVRISTERLVGVSEAELSSIDERLIALKLREEDVSSIYDISRMIGTGGSLREVLPHLVGRVTQALDATVGCALIWVSATDRLELVPRIWFDGVVKTVPYTAFQLTDANKAEGVFVTGTPYVDNFTDEREVHDPLIALLGISRVAMVPLQIEQRTIGVLVLGDKRAGSFTTDDISRLAALAGPTALVVRQIARYEDAMHHSDELEEIARMKSDFVSVVSHELRSPLTSIIGSLTTLQRPELLPGNVNARNLISSARRQADRLRMLIEDLLVVSRVDNRALPVRPVAVELAAFLHDTVQLIRGNSPVDVTIETAQDVPIVHTDPEHLRRIATNLLTNAFRYAEGSDIEIKLRLENDDVRVAFIDHGPGIPFDRREYIFKPFTQLQPHETRQRGGTGLGLSIVAGLATTLDAEIRYEPTPGGGSTFVLTLPVKAAVRRVT